MPVWCLGKQEIPNLFSIGLPLDPDGNFTMHHNPVMSWRIPCTTYPIPSYLRYLGSSFSPTLYTTCVPEHQTTTSQLNNGKANFSHNVPK